MDIGGDGGARRFQDLSSDRRKANEAVSGVSRSGGVPGKAGRSRDSRQEEIPIEKDVGVGATYASCGLCPCHSLPEWKDVEAAGASAAGRNARGRLGVRYSGGAVDSGPGLRQACRHSPTGERYRLRDEQSIRWWSQSAVATGPEVQAGAAKRTDTARGGVWLDQSCFSSELERRRGREAERQLCYMWRCR